MTINDLIKINDENEYHRYYKAPLIDNNRLTYKELEKITEAKHKFWDEYMSKFGQPEAFKQRNDLIYRIGMLRCELLKTGMFHLKTQIKILEDELREMDKENAKKGNQSFASLVASAELKYSFGFDLKTSANVFYNRLNVVTNG